MMQVLGQEQSFLKWRHDNEYNDIQLNNTKKKAYL